MKQDAKATLGLFEDILDHNKALYQKELNAGEWDATRCACCSKEIPIESVYSGLYVPEHGFLDAREVSEEDWEALEKDAAAWHAEMKPRAIILVKAKTNGSLVMTCSASAVWSDEERMIYPSGTCATITLHKKRPKVSAAK